MATLTGKSLNALFNTLLAAHGPQAWWPRQDPDNPRFEIFIGAVLTQHTAWRNAAGALACLHAAGPLTPQALLAHHDLAAIIRQAGSHRIKARRLQTLCHWFVQEGGFAALDCMATKELRRKLRTVHGIGPETADVIVLYAFGRSAFIADAYAFRLLERCGLWQGASCYEQLANAVESAAAFNVSQFQELHALIVAHAKTHCRKQRPACGHCPLLARCPEGAEIVEVGGIGD